MASRRTRADRIARLDRELRRMTVLHRYAVLRRGGRRPPLAGYRTRAEPT